MSFCIVILFMGAGCVSKDNSENNTPQEEKPVLTELQAAYAHCLEQGYKASLSFDTEEGRLKLLCVFTEQASCDAVDFLKETCRPIKKPRIAQTDDVILLEDIENAENTSYSCDNTILPVCGTDGFTYTNTCIAEAQKVTIFHDGACKDVAELLEADDPTEPQTDTKKTNSTKNTNNTKNENTSIVSESGSTEWLETIKQFASKESSTTPVRIEKCTLQGKNVYKKTGDVEILYNTAGTLLCFPNKDPNGVCPAQLSTAACATIWTK